MKQVLLFLKNVGMAMPITIETRCIGMMVCRQGGDDGMQQNI